MLCYVMLCYELPIIIAYMKLIAYNETVTCEGFGATSITKVTRFKGVTAPQTKKLACFVLYLKIINTFLKNNMYISNKFVQGTQKWD